MERFKTFLRSLNSWKLLLFTILSLSLLASVIFASKYLRRSAQLELGSDSGLTLTVDREDALGAFSDTSFTLKSDQDLTSDMVKNNIVFFPEIDFDVRQVSTRQYKITPRALLADNRLYRVRANSTQRTFSWAFQTKNNFRVVQSLPRDKANYVPLNTGIEVTFSHDNYESIERGFEITPPVEGRFERHGRTTSFVPNSLSPDTLYTVKISKGIKLKGSSEVLKDDFIFRFETQSNSQNRSQLNFSRNFYEFSSSETPAFDIYTSITGSLDLSVKVYQYPSSQAFSSDFIAKVSIPEWASNTARLNRRPVTGLNKVLEFSAPVQHQTFTNFILFPQTLPTGFYLVEGNIGGGGGVTTQALVQITNLSAYTTVSGTKTLVWVNDVKGGISIADAQVNFAGVQQTTDGSGVAYFDSPVATLDENKLLSIQKGDQSLYIPLKSSRYYYDSSYQKTRRSADKYWTYFYTDRPAYLPTDTLKFWGLLRDRDSMNQKQKFTLEVTRTDYNSWDFTPVVLLSKELETSDMGTYIGDIPLSSYNPGWYNISLKIGDSVVSNSAFTVETYTKPAYRLNLFSSKRAAILGEVVTFSGQASFFEGSPVPGMDLRYYLEGKSTTITTDSLGRFSFNYTTSTSSNYSPDYKYLSVSPLLPEEGLIQADTNLAVFNSSLVFNTSKSQTKDKIGRVEFDLRLVDTTKFTSSGSLNDFLPAPSRQISGSLMENQWNRIEVGTYYDFINKVTSPRYEYNRVQNKIADISLTTDPGGHAVYEFPVSEGKSYNLVVQAIDDRGLTTSQDTFVSGYGDSHYLNNYVYLKTDKGGNDPNSYSVGETVNLQVMKGDTPLESSATDKFLYLFAQRGLKSYQLGDGNQISFKYSDAYVPNIVVSAIRFTGKTYQVTESLNLRFNTLSKKLNIRVGQDKATYLPGDTAKLSISTKDQNGSGAASEVNLSLLDEAYSALYSTNVDPLSRIYNSLDSDIIASYQSHQYPLDVSGAEGGGCFLPGTQVLLDNGSTKNIEDIVVGDSIKTLTSPNSSKLISAKVSKVFQHQVAGYLVFNNHLRVTAEHNLYLNGRFMTAAEAKVGDFYLDQKGDYQKVFSIEEFSGLNTVYNFTVDKQNTYFADGFYVHNDKGRELFVDNAYFGSVKTNTDGQASLDIKLPDNLTSWKITAQAITSDLKAGIDSSLLVVKQPFFVDVVMNTEYLVGEKPKLIIRAFGEGLSSSDTVSLRVQSDSLRLDKTLSLKAFESTTVDLGELKEGLHQLTITGTSGKLSDKLVRSLRVVKSRLQITKADHTRLTPETKPTGSINSQTTLIFSDLSLGRFFPPLSNLAYTHGDRLDQRLARSLSQELIFKVFDDTISPEKLDLTAFQALGGYSLFPYSSADLELSAFVAALVKDKVDTVGLANYLYQQFSLAKEPDSAAISLFGLASLNEPVLVLINNFSSLKDLTPLSRIYLNLAQAQIGDQEKATSTYRSLMSQYSEKQDTFTFLKIGRNKDEYLKATSLMSAVASLLSQPEADSLLAYTLANSAKDVLLVIPQLLAISNQVNHAQSQDISFSYLLNGKKVSKNLQKGQTFRLSLSPSEISNISFQDISGNVGLATSFSTSMNQENAHVDSSIHVGRTYSVKGRETNSFTATDLIKVTLPVSIKELSQDGCYQVSDLLPSGLKPITSVYSFGLDSHNIWYPYEINGQRVSFCMGKDSSNKTINYYARVISAGEYKAESALIQSLISPSVYNLTPSSSVIIK